ncbi:MAG: branched-chain amino acid aminotransferase [Thermoleophilia bacterium]|nr:branched-chain amino acid aminotransferase [Thermoleophilia bacterium]
MSTTSQSASSPTAQFGTVFADRLTRARWGVDGGWGEWEVAPVADTTLHPASHCLHYASTIFEGLKAHRGGDGTVRIFRLPDHVARMQRSAPPLHLPVPDERMLTEMIVEAVRTNLDAVPEAPGSLYLRPTLLGVQPNIGAAASPSNEALLFVLASPVGAYFAGGALRVEIETLQGRTMPGFGTVKSGLNYALALGPIGRAKAAHNASQVLFCPGGRVEETGAANVVLIDAERVVTPALTAEFLHGVTRDSVLSLAADLGYHVEERTLHIDEVIDWANRPGAEIALSGTAAVLSPVGTLILDGEDVTVGSGEVGPHTTRIREEMGRIQTGREPDRHGWLTAVTA